MHIADQTPQLLITRPPEDAHRVAALAREAGLKPLVSPVLELEYYSKIVSMKGVAALAFTSANGVRAFVRLTPALPQIKTFAIGGMTAEVARAAGFTDVRAAGGDVESLASTIIAENVASPLDGAVLHLAGSSVAGDLVGALRGAGVAAVREVLYQARPAGALTPEAVAAIRERPGSLWVALFSPRSARVFLELVAKAGLADRLAEMGAACLSPAVGAAAMPAQWAEVRIAPKRDAAALVTMVSQAISGQNS